MKINSKRKCSLENSLILTFNRFDNTVNLSPCWGLYPLDDNTFAKMDAYYFINNFSNCLSSYKEQDYSNLYKSFNGNCNFKLKDSYKTMSFCLNYTGNKQIKNITNSISSECILNCIMCGPDHNKNQVERDIYVKTTKLFQNIELDSYEFTINGEPLLFKELITDYIINSKTKIIKITTNGFLLDEDYIKLLYDLSKKYNRQLLIRVSLDAITKDTYEKIRLGSNFEKVFNNILLLKKYNLLDLIQYVEQEENFIEYNTKYEFFKKYNLKYLILQKFNYTNTGEMYRYTKTEIV